MAKSRYTDEKIAFALKQAETGTPVAEVIRRMGTFGETTQQFQITSIAEPFEVRENMER